MTRLGAGDISDLATVTDLDENLLIKELETRYRRNVIYTYLGDILLSINPYKDLPLYGPGVGKRYSQTNDSSRLPPHPFVTAGNAYRRLCNERTNQCFVLTGESGAGKTETTKMLIAHLMRLCSATDDVRYLQNKIIEVNPLLEAFGNAQTSLNINASRFAKFLELHFTPDGALCGAKISEYMLEKSRITHLGPADRNFNVFYHLLAGMSGEDQQKYQLDRAHTYRILSSSSGDPVFANESEYTYHRGMYAHLINVLSVLGFSQKLQDDIFIILSAVLHIGNIQFAKDASSNRVSVANPMEVQVAAAILSLRAEHLDDALVTDSIQVRGETLVSLKTHRDAIECRDSLARSLYSRLISWIVERLNETIQSRSEEQESHTKIGILDMAGFENIHQNTFEQLCTNVANEQLQNYANRRIFSLELHETQADGLKPPKVGYASNDKILDLLLQKPNGLFSLLDAECRHSKVTDEAFLSKCEKQLGKSPHFKGHSKTSSQFTIYHCAGEVVYDVTGFIDKNRHTISSNMVNMMRESENFVVSELFSREVSHVGTIRGKRKKKGKGELSHDTDTASAYFRNSLSELMMHLSQSEPHFIRCVKPNNKKAPNNFDPNVVRKQLHSTGVMDTIRMRRVGYPTRIPFDDFLRRYKFISFPLTALVRSDSHSCQKILRQSNIRDFQVGKTKVFLKYWHLDYLHRFLDSMVRKVVIAQSAVRGRLARTYCWHLRKQRNLDRGRYQQSNNVYRSRMAQQLAEEVVGERHRRRVNRGISEDVGLNDQPEADYFDDDDDDESSIGRPIVNTNAPGYFPGYIEEDIYAPLSKGSDWREDPVVQNALRDVIEKLPELNADIWCKVVYMERHLPIAKFYVREREVIIDGSEEASSATRLCLGSYFNIDRDEKTERIRDHIGKGISLKKDGDKNICVTKLCKNDVIVKGNNDPANHCFSEDVVISHGELDQGQTVKIFDMTEFKSHIGLGLNSGRLDYGHLQEKSVIGLSFIQDDDQPMDTPCWLLIINIMALLSLDSPDVMNEVKSNLVRLVLRDEKEVAGEDNSSLQANTKKESRPWSKVYPRRELAMHNTPLRKTRMDLRQNQKEVKDHMDYSWDDKYYDRNTRHLNINEIESDVEKMNSAQAGRMRRSDIPLRDGRRRISEPRKSWAKISLAMKDSDQEAANAVMQAKRSEMGVE